MHRDEPGWSRTGGLSPKVSPGIALRTPDMTPCASISASTRATFVAPPVHRQHVDDVGPAASLVAVAEQLSGDRVTVGFVVDQDAAERVAGFRVEAGEGGSKVAVLTGRWAGAAWTRDGAASRRGPPT